MYNYHTLINDFLQYKQFLGFKYKTDKIVLNEIKKYLVSNNIEVITKEVTENYARINCNLTSNTIARNMGVFREFNKYLKLQKGIDCYQIPNKLYPQNHHNFTPYIFNHDEIKRIYSNLEVNLRIYSYYSFRTYPLIIKILYSTGMRIGEVLNLTLNDYDNEQGVFLLRNTKNNEERYVAISDSLNKEILEYCHKFYYNKNDNEKIFKITITHVEKYFRKVLKLSNINIIERKTVIHSLRHTFIVHNIEKAIENKQDLDVFLPILQAQVGHKSLESLAYYFHITNDLLNIVNKISEDKLGYLIREVDFNE